jgi:hypothetical protein
MQYQLILSPTLGISPDTFVSTWNNETDKHAIAHAELLPSADTRRSFNDPLVEIVLFVVTNVGLGLGTNAIYDLIKNALSRHGHNKRTKITKLDQPDGTHLLIIEEEE